MSNFLKCLIVGASFLATQSAALANNIAVTNVTLTGQNTTAGPNNSANFSMVRFDLSWENSWRVSTGPANWDAAWVFVKFRVGASNPEFNGVTLTNGSAVVNLTSTANLRVGMPVVRLSGSSTVPTNTVILQINSATQITLSNNISGTSASNNNLRFLRIWEHASLNNTGHTAASGSTIDAGLLTPGTAFNATTNPAVGAFIYRSSAGTGTNTFNNTQLRWNYGANGISDDAIVNVRIFAIEMVYVPQGSFFVGSSGTESGSFTDGSWTSGNTIPFQITSENALTIGQSAGNLWGTSSSGNNTIGGAGTLAASYPKGFAAFYCMKYEISQGQYRDFLNTLTYQQQVGRTATAPTSAAGTGALSSTNANRNGLDIQTPGNASTLVPAVYGCNLNGNTTYNEAADGEWIACNFLSWQDGCAYMQWSGLRPMTELEYEKACRGDQAAVSGEYAWGNATVTGATGISSGGTNTETFSNAGANAAFNNVAGVQGPLRVGAFAGAATTRAQAGATYYGIMEMSGNLWERAVTIGNAAGRSYTGLHGNGTLFRDGTANVDFWPGINGNSATTTANTAFGGTTGITQAAGSGFRGGGWRSAATHMRVSDRNLAADTLTSRLSNIGFRGVRLAP